MKSVSLLEIRDSVSTRYISPFDYHSRETKRLSRTRHEVVYGILDQAFLYLQKIVSNNGKKWFEVKNKRIRIQFIFLLKLKV